MSFTVARLAYGDTASGSDTTCAVPSTLPVGAFLVAFVSSSGGGSTIALTDTQSNTWSQRAYASNATSPSAVVAIFTCPVTTQLTTADHLTGSSSAGSGCGDILLCRVTVDSGSISFGLSSTGTGATTSVAVASFSPTSTSLVMAAACESGASLNSSTTAGAGFTKLAGVDAHVRTRAVVGQYRTSGGATTAPMTITPAGNWAIAAISLVQTTPPPVTMEGEFAGAVFNGTTSKTHVIPVTAAVPSGNVAVLAVNVPAGGGANTAAGTTCNDTAGNTWTVRELAVQTTTGGNSQVFLMTSTISVALTTSDTITVVVDNFGAIIWAWCGISFTGILGYDKGAFNVGATNQLINSGTTAAAAQNVQAVVAAFGYTGTGVTLTNLVPSGFTAQAVRATTGTVRNLCVVWGFVNASGTRTVTASPSDSASHAWCGAIVALNANPPAPEKTDLFLLEGVIWQPAEELDLINGAWEL